MSFHHTLARWAFTKYFSGIFSVKTVHSFWLVRFAFQKLIIILNLEITIDIALILNVFEK